MSLGRRVVGNELSGSACKRFKYFFAKLTLVQDELSERLTLEQLYNSLGGEGSHRTVQLCASQYT